MEPQLELCLIEEKGDDSRWSIIRYGPIVYLTCNKVRAEWIIKLIQDTEKLQKHFII